MLAGLVLTGLAVYLGQAWWRGPQMDVERVARRDLVQTVVGSGRVESPFRVGISSQITATVAGVPVAEGTAVHAGEVLVELAAGDLLAVARQADLAVVQARARLRQVRTVQAPLAEQTLRQAGAQLDSARAALRRSQTLVQKGFIGQVALEDAARAVELGEAQFASARLQRDSVAAAGSEDVLASGAVVEAQAAADAAHARAGFARIRAPRDGLLISRHVEAGDVVQPGKLLMTLSPAGSMQLVLEVDEKNLRLIHVGQKALASADAYSQQNFEATVAYINPGVNPQTGAVQVKLRVDQPPPYLQQDMTVSVDVEVARRPRALVLALTAVRAPDSAAPWALVLSQGRAHRVALTLGSRSGGMVEVVSGLAEGDAVLLASAAAGDGQRVRSKPPGI